MKTYLAAIAHMAEAFAMPPDLLSEEQVRQYLIDRRTKLAMNSMRPIVGAVKFFYRVTVPRDWPTLAAMRLPKSRTVPKVLSPTACWRIIESTRTLYLQAALRTAYTCGLRLIDVRHLRPRDVDADSLTLRICHSKGRHQRTVPIPQGTIDALRRYWLQHRNEHLLFPSRSSMKTIATTKQPISERSLQRGLSDVLTSMDLSGKGIVFHTMRHSYATAMLDAGVNLMVLSRYLGHKNLTATEVYLHLTPSSDAKARRIAEAIMNGPPAEEHDELGSEVTS